MKVIAHGLRRLSPAGGLMKVLKDDPALALEFGRMTTKIRKNFSQAYPSETRVQKFTVSDWEKAGHKEVADVTRMMGLDGY